MTALAFWVGAYFGGIVYHIMLCFCMSDKIHGENAPFGPQTFALYLAHGIIWPWFIGKMAWDQLNK